MDLDCSSPCLCVEDYFNYGKVSTTLNPCDPPNTLRPCSAETVKWDVEEEVKVEEERRLVTRQPSMPANDPAVRAFQESSQRRYATYFREFFNGTAELNRSILLDYLRDILYRRR